MAGFFRREDKEKEKEEQEKIGRAMQSLSDQIAALQQQNKGKDDEIDRLQQQLKQSQAASGDEAKQQLRELQSALAVAQADKQANDIMLQNAQKQIADLQAQLQALSEAAKDQPSATYTASGTAAPAGMAVGVSAYVRNVGGKNLRRRGAPGLDANILDGIAPGTQLTLLEGPIPRDNYTWWRVRVSDGREGWVAGEELVTTPD